MSTAPSDTAAGGSNITLPSMVATFCLLYAFPLLLLGDAPSTAGDIARPIGWAFAWWGVGLYWWAGLLYLRQVRDVISAARREATGTAGAGERTAPSEGAATP